MEKYNERTAPWDSPHPTSARLSARSFERAEHHSGGDRLRLRGVGGLDHLALAVGERAHVGERGRLDDVGRDALAGGRLARSSSTTLASPSASWPSVTESMRKSRSLASRRSRS